VLVVGRQNVNKVETAVRHIPTGIAAPKSEVSCKIKESPDPKAKLLIIAQEQRAQEIAQIRGDMVKLKCPDP